MRRKKNPYLHVSGTVGHGNYENIVTDTRGPNSWSKLGQNFGSRSKYMSGSSRFRAPVCVISWTKLFERYMLGATYRQNHDICNETSCEGCLEMEVKE